MPKRISKPSEKICVASSLFHLSGMFYHDCMPETYVYDSLGHSLTHYHKKGNGISVIFIHGGGLTCGSKSDADTFADTFLEYGIDVISVDYGLYPDTEYPEFILQCALAVRYSLDSALVKGKVYLYGVSAGAYIAMMLAYDSRYLGTFGLSASLFDGFVFDSGQVSMHFHIAEVLKMENGAINEYAPWTYIEGTAMRDDARILVVSSEHDMPGRLEENRKMHQKLLDMGFNSQFLYMEGCSHCSYNSEQSYIDKIASFIIGQDND